MLGCAVAKAYKIYSLDPSDHVIAVQFVTADDDAAAIVAARELQNFGAYEIWDGERRVAIIELRQSDQPSAAMWL